MNNAVQNSVGIVQQAASIQKAQLKVSTGDKALDTGIQYVVDQVPEALSRFGITQPKLESKIRAKLGLAAVATNLATTASAEPIVAGPLASVQMDSISELKAA